MDKASEFQPMTTLDGPGEHAAPAARFVTLGCKVNQYETAWVREGLVSAGYRDAVAGEPASLCIVNTCTVTANGDANSRQVIRRLARENPDSRIVVMGCYATRASEEVRRLPQVVEVVTDKRELPDLLGRLGVIDLPTGIHRFGDHQRAFVKVQDGCLLRCSYCIIPQVRPHMESRPVEAIAAEVCQLVENGYQEIVLTGIHLGHYGVDLNQGQPRHAWSRLSTLVQRLLQLRGDFRIRLSSIEATEVTRDLLAVMRDNPDRVCPHLHVCVQSGSDRILRKMRRRWGAQRILDRCLLASAELADVALTTDVIVGFPGETDDDFELTCGLVEAAQFCQVHVFPFSPRRGTPAAEFSEQVPASIKKVRTAHLQQLAQRLQGEYRDRLVGRTIQVLIEGETPRGPAGTSCRYLPTQICPPPGSAVCFPLRSLVAARVIPSAGPVGMESSQDSHQSLRADSREHSVFPLQAVPISATLQ